jgi:hypothetical protein
VGELLDAWLDDEKGCTALLGVDEESLAKPARKLVRRARHRLRSQGRDVGESRPSKPVVATLPPAEEPLRGAFVSAADPRGSCLVYLVEPNPAGGARLFEIVTDPLRGIVSFDAYDVRRSRIRRFMKDLPKHSGFPVAEAEPESARSVIAHAARAQPADRPAPRGFEEWRARLTAGAEPARLPGAIARDALAVEATPGLCHAAGELIRSNALGPWPPAQDRLEAVSERVREIAEGKVIVSGARKRERLAAAIDEAVATIFDEAFTTATAERFEHSAYVLWRSAREDDARACLAAASAMRAGDVRENPATRALLEVVLAPILAAAKVDQENRDDATEEPSLLVRP